MKNKIKLFDKLVFWEMFNQLKITGIIASAIYVVIGLITSMGLWVSTIGNNGTYVDYFPGEFYYILLPLVYIFVPIMVKSVFTYQNRRNSSDFYHALPIKRETMYFSSLVAVVAWMIGIITISTILPTMTTIFLPQFKVDFQGTAEIIGKMIAIGILVMAGFSVGINLTGNNFTNVIVSLMILFIPRVISTAIFYMIKGFMPFIDMNSGNSLINNGYNLAFGWAWSLFSVGPGQLPYFAPVIYTLVLAAIYLVLGALAHKFRRSEMAAQPSAYGAVQIVTRMIPAFLFALIGIYCFLYLQLTPAADLEYVETITVYWAMFSMFVLSLLSYVIYELITTRKWRKVLHSFKQLPILAGIVVLCTTAIWVGTKATMNRDIDADKMKYIEVGSIDAFGWYDFPSEVRIEDEEVFEMLERTYDTQMEKYEMGEYYGDDADELVIGVNQGGLTFYRIFHIKYDDMKLLELAYLEAAKTEKVKLDIPKYSKVDMNVYPFDFDSRTEEEIYNTLRAELQEIPYVDIVDVEEEDILTEISVWFYQNNRGYDVSIPISDKTPKTLNKIMKYVASSNYEDTYYIEDFLYKFNNRAPQDYGDLSIHSVIIQDGDKIYKYMDYYFSMDNGYQISELTSLLDEYLEDEGDVMVYIRGEAWWYNDEDEYKYDNTFECSRNVSKDLAQKLIKFMEKYN